MFEELTDVLGRIEGLDAEALVRRCAALHAARCRVFFIGNGASAAISDHMAADWMKAGGFSAFSLNAAPALTAIANDIGYDQVFAVQLRAHACARDLLVAISSSGRSRNILAAAKEARHLGMHIVTLSGFSSDNPLRQLGHENIYVPSYIYGVVEVAHHAILHGILDRVVPYGGIPDPALELCSAWLESPLHA